MIGIFFETLFTGRIIFLALLSTAAGVMLGGSRLGWIGVPVVLAILLFVLMLLLFTSAAVDTLVAIGRTGAGGFDTNAVIILHMIVHPAWLILVTAVTRYGRVLQDAERKQTIVALTDQEIVDELNITAAHPDVASSGWFATTWIPMSDSEKMAWVARHGAPIRDLWLQGEDDGLRAAGIDLPLLLAQMEVVRGGK